MLILNAFSRLRVRAALVVLLGLPVLLNTPAARAADLGDDCCADLEERIAELEETVVRTGNRAIELEIYGSVSQGLLYWDDGRDSNVYVVNVDNGLTSVGLEGEVDLEDQYEGWSMGLILEFDVGLAGSGVVNQDNDDGDINPTLIDSSWWVEHESLGRLTVGFTANTGSSGGANANDLSGTDVASFVDVREIGGGFALRRGSGELLALNWDELIDPLDTPDGNVVVYDTPTVAGFSASALWGEDDVWSFGVGFEGTQKGVGEVASSIAYSESSEGEEDGTFDYRQIVGSVAVLHAPTGVHFLVAAGKREFMEPALLNSGRLATPDDAWFFYLKSGLVAKLNGAGATRFYGEFGEFNDFQGNAIDVESVAGLAGINEAGVCGGQGVACGSSESKARVWGFGVVQDIDAAESKIFIGYRRHEAEIDLVDAAGAAVSGGSIEDFDTLISGMIIEF